MTAGFIDINIDSDNDNDNDRQAPNTLTTTTTNSHTSTAIINTTATSTNININGNSSSNGSKFLFNFSSRAPSEPSQVQVFKSSSSTSSSSSSSASSSSSNSQQQRVVAGHRPPLQPQKVAPAPTTNAVSNSNNVALTLTEAADILLSNLSEIGIHDYGDEDDDDEDDEDEDDNEEALASDDQHDLSRISSKDLNNNNLTRSGANQRKRNGHSTPLASNTLLNELTLMEDEGRQRADETAAVGASTSGGYANDRTLLDSSIDRTLNDDPADSMHQQQQQFSQSVCAKIAPLASKSCNNNNNDSSIVDDLLGDIYDRFNHHGGGSGGGGGNRESSCMESDVFTELSLSSSCVSSRCFSGGDSTADHEFDGYSKSAKLTKASLQSLSK